MILQKPLFSKAPLIENRTPDASLKDLRARVANFVSLQNFLPLIKNQKSKIENQKSKIENQKSKIKNYFVFFLFPFFCYSFSLSPDRNNTYYNENRLFHIERSVNRNIVCYDINIDARTGAPDARRPITVYWINREERPGRRGDLSFIQERFAYGYSVTGNNNGVINIVLNAVKNRAISIELKDEKYFCKIEINNRPAALQKIFVKTKPNNSLQVEYVEIHGIALASGTVLVERVFPD